MTTKPENWKAWTEPESVANEDNPPKYPYNTVWQSQSGHSFQMDDTPNRERVRLEHRSGTFIEMHPDGTEVHKVYGNGYEITIKDKNVLVQGSCIVEIQGDVKLNIKGDKTEYIEGNYDLRVGGNFSQLTEGIASIVSKGDLEVRAAASATGALKLSTGDSINIRGDLTVNGEITGSKITSLGRVDAVTGISAGPLGFVSEFGGLSIGVPVAVPGNIICLNNIIGLNSIYATSSMYAGMSVNAGVSVNAGTSINSGVSITSGATISAGGLISTAGQITAGAGISSSGSISAPLGNFAIMDALVMTDSLNTGVYDIHTHIAPFGPTTPPIPSMF
jgi:hypothetical protein